MNDTIVCFKNNEYKRTKIGMVCVECSMCVIHQNSVYIIPVKGPSMEIPSNMFCGISVVGLYDSDGIKYIHYNQQCNPQIYF